MLEERLERATDPDTAEFMPLRLGPNMPPIEELWRERLDRVPHETLIVWGREDRMNPIDQGMVLMRQIPNARFLVMPQMRALGPMGEGRRFQSRRGRLPRELRNHLRHLRETVIHVDATFATVRSERRPHGDRRQAAL